MSAALTDAMNRSSGPWDREVDEFADAGLDKAACETIDCARVAAAPASLECRLTQILHLPGEANFAVFGTVTGVHMRDDCMVEGRFDVTRFHPLSRLGYTDYAVIRETFSLARPER